VAELNDAIEVVTDPANLIVSDSHSNMRRVNAKRAMSALRDRGAGKGEARALITEAVQKLDGRVEAEVRTAGRTVGPDARNASDVWLVPVTAIREP
jgi:hypothetical protein